MITPQDIRQRLQTVMDPELNVDIVSLGLIYDVAVKPHQTPDGERPQVHILMTLTTPGCPLSAVFETLVKDALNDLKSAPQAKLQFDPDQDVILELTFDPPWTPEMMSAEARAELGFD